MNIQPSSGKVETTRSYPKFQAGGTVADADRQILEATAQALKKASPEDVLKMLVKAGVPQEKAVAAIKQVMQSVTSAKSGSKLEYISMLRGKCPKGYEMKYKDGGQFCMKCIDNKNKKEEPSYIAKFKKERSAKRGGKI